MPCQVVAQPSLSWESVPADGGEREGGREGGREGRREGGRERGDKVGE